MTAMAIASDGILRVFAELGSAVERQWRDRDYDNARLPAIASNALLEASLDRRISDSELMEHVLFATRLPPQTFRAFGQPPVNLYVGPHFYVEANFWLNGTTTIHDHGFSGAFCLLSGESLHARYEFEERDRVNSHLQLGVLHLKEAALQHPGDVKTIEPGEELIHAVFHLTRPSITIVIRNHADERARTQRDYHPPGVAEDVRFDPEPLKTRLALLDTVAAVDRGRYLELLERFLHGTNRYESYRVLGQSFAHVGDDTAWGSLLAIVESRHGEFARAIEACFEERRRRERLARLRRTVKDEDLCFFLGLMMNLPDRTHVDRLLRTRFPQQSTEDLAIEWVKRLSDRGALAPAFDDFTLSVLHCAIRGTSPAETLNLLGHAFPLMQPAPTLDMVQRALSTLQRVSLLRPLFVHTVDAKRGT